MTAGLTAGGRHAALAAAPAPPAAPSGACWKEVGTTSVTADGTRIANTWADVTVGQAVLQPKTIEDYPWSKETDEGSDEIALTRPALVVHNVQDALNNNPLMAEIIDRDTFRMQAEFEAVKSFVVLKVKDVMKGLLTMENSDGEEFVDYNYLRRDLGDPFGEVGNGSPREWVITHRYNPGYDDFELDDAYVEVKPLDDVTTAYAIMEGEVEKVDDGVVTVRTYIDTANSAEVVYSTLKDIKVEEGDEVKEGQKLGKMKGSTLRIKYYEINDAALQIETKKDWAYDVGLYMDGFAGYEEPEEPKEYVNMGGDWAGCTTVVEFAHSRLGCLYVWGATGPDTFDCSGLTQWCYAQAGIIIPRNSEAQRAGGQVIPLSEVQPGDILWKPGHVGIYIGENLYIHAPHTGDVVKISGNAKGAFTLGVRYGRS
ncbi:MAG: C40 family peptidase [Eggerthellaceae bacterium]|nr:C40 family peptidase [Eggerthellaceae bacterium]